MKRRLQLALAQPMAIGLLVTAACRTSPPHARGNTSAEVEAVCRAQQDAWNHGDIEGFMRSGYAQSDALTFFSGGDVTRGFDTVLARYRKRYTAEGAEMGHLSFTQLETRELGREHALLRGRWDLDFEKRSDVGGLFSLILQRTSDGWRIVHDHTSVDSPKSD